MDWYKIIHKYACQVNIKEKKKDEVLKKLAEIASESSESRQLKADEIYQALKTREEDSPTAFGSSIAIPHATIKGLKEFFVFIVTSKEGVDFNALDGKKVHLFFVVLAPEKRERDHLKILASISRMMHVHGVKDELIKSQTPTALYENFLKSTWSSEYHHKLAKGYKLLFVVLYLEELIYDILELFLEEDIDGATILNSTGMGEYISNVPVFASFIGFLNNAKHNSKTIVALVPDHKVDLIIRGIEQLTGNLDNQEGAMIMTLNIDHFKSSMKMI